MLIDWTQLAKNIHKALRKEISETEGIPKLVAILVWNSQESLRYIKNKKKTAEKIGIDFELKKFPLTITEEELLSEIMTLNTDNSVSGFMIQLPLPKHFHAKKIIEHIAPEKDVDGFHPINQGKIVIGDTSALLPCTPAGIMHIFSENNISLSGKIVCVIGRSNIVGKPVTNLLINAGATVISCNSKTPDLEAMTLQSDIIIAAAGVVHLVKDYMVKKDAIIIDVGFSVVDDQLFGDCDTEKLDAKGCAVTPVPGGVWPLTVAFLMKNTVLAHNNIHGEK